MRLGTTLRFVLCCVFALNWESLAKATQIVSVQPLTRRILVVHFDDGYVRHHLLGEPRTNEWVVGQALDTSLASQPTTYLLASSQDSNYSTPLSPVGIHRKSKPTDFTWLCQAWNGNCINTSPDHAKEHWIYLRLPHDMQNGKTYALLMPGLSLPAVVFDFHDRVHRSEAVHVNQIGYVPSATEKYGYVYHWLGDGGGMNFTGLQNANFYLIRTSDGGIAFTGQIAFRKAFNNVETGWPSQTPNGNFLGSDVYECNFSSFSTPGEYRLSVEGIGCSFPFVISDNVYWTPFDAVMNGLYQQRSGIATVQPFTMHPRPAPHNPLVTPGFAGKLVYSRFRYNDFSESNAPVSNKPAIEALVEGPLDAWGWYQDAGDWDSYYAHTNLPMFMMALYEMAPSKFGDNQLNLPEAGNGFPDLLDEATWQLRFLRRLRAEILAKDYGSGGVGGGRVFGDLWGGEVLPNGTTQGSWQDTARTWVCTGEDPFMTYKYAGLAAQIAFLISQNGLTDTEGINWAQEATSAFQWASQNTLPGDNNLFGLPLSHVRLFAAAQLYRLTGAANYHQSLLADFAALPSGYTFSEELLFGFFAYSQTEAHRPVNTSTLQTVRNRIAQEANFVMNTYRNNRACRWGGNFWMPMLIGQPTTPLVFSGILGHHILKNSQPSVASSYLAGLYSTADYFLGNNPLNMTWITGVGDRSPSEIFCLDGWYLDSQVPRQGIVPYGPWDASGSSGSLGPWNHHWAFQYTYPPKTSWPGHEAWFEQRTSPKTNEMTIHQTLGPSIFTYGYLYALTGFQNAFSNISSVAVYYSGSALDNGDLSSAKDNNKIVYRQTATHQSLGYDNLINAQYGITGLLFEVENLPVSSLSSSDFVFQMSPTGAFNLTANPPTAWPLAPAPNAIQVVAGSPSRVLVRWPNDAIANRWLRATMKATQNTGLASDETFFIGHLRGETTGLADGTYTVAFADISLIRAGVGGTVNASSILDIDKNGVIAFADISAMRSNVGTQLSNIVVP